MEHDPLCPKNEPIKDALVALVWNCSCELISRVRNDQMRKDFEFLLNPCIGCGTDEYASYVCDKCEGEWWVEEEQDLKDLENDPRLLWNVFADFADEELTGGMDDGK